MEQPSQRRQPCVTRLTAAAVISGELRSVMWGGRVVAVAQLVEAPSVVSESDSLLFASCGRRPCPPDGVIASCAHHRTIARRTARSSLQGVISSLITFPHPSLLIRHLSPSPFASHPRLSLFASRPRPSPLVPSSLFSRRARWLH
ncbi:hypothetical protein E2C01_057391 [Portunus trituberculatus]|uniref:Uncharacterized protein n=1 Tax=Portunus trituberculatus TaxID=210409 RepID=A0A5B7H0X9_PORTR|nr:hypothetical protein [Portunus trituberculatus]